jgi:hypothetical protein
VGSALPDWLPFVTQCGEVVASCGFLTSGMTASGEPAGLRIRGCSGCRSRRKRRCWSPALPDTNHRDAEGAKARRYRLAWFVVLQRTSPRPPEVRADGGCLGIASNLAVNIPLGMAGNLALNIPLRMAGKLALMFRLSEPRHNPRPSSFTPSFSDSTAPKPQAKLPRVSSSIPHSEIHRGPTSKKSRQLAA